MDSFTTTEGYKMQYLIKRRTGTGREELVAHWFANHMPNVIEMMQTLKVNEKPHASRYIATLFDAAASGEHSWDGVAQLWWSVMQERPNVAHGKEPTDTFQQKALPYVPWPTKEYVIIDGSERLPVTPLTLNAPFPTTRSGICKITFLVKAQINTDYQALFRHWLDVHAPNVASVMLQAGGFRYVVSHSVEPEREAYAGMAELYFDDLDGWRRYKKLIKADGMEQWTEEAGTLVLRSQTEMVGIP
jgi:hypothetical protein